MRYRRALRLVFLAVVLLAGAAEGAAARTHAIPVPAGLPGWSEPGAPLPVPSHNESTCVFCHSGVVQHYAPPTAAAILDVGTARRREPVPAEERFSHITSGRPASSRAPPVLRTA